MIDSRRYERRRRRACSGGQTNRRCSRARAVTATRRTPAEIAASWGECRRSSYHPSPTSPAGFRRSFRRDRGVVGRDQTVGIDVGDG